MDFALSETQDELIGLARQILSDRMTLPHLKEVQRSDEGFDRDTWNEFAKANLLGIAIPEAQGGLGLGFLDLCLVLREVGKHVAPLPLVPCLVSAAMAGARFGGAEHEPYLAEIASGELIATAAFSEYGTDAYHPYVTATPDGDGWRIDGTKTVVPFVNVAGGVLVSTRVAGTGGRDDIAMFFVPAGGDHQTVKPQTGQNYERLFEVTYDGLPVAREQLLGTVEQGREILDWVLARTQLAMCALVGGVCDEAIRITAQYTCDRKQFERAIGTFQAVSQRMGDAFINNRAIELTMLQAATHLDEGREVPDEVATAKWWACEGGNHIGHACLHIHGGISIDLDYPIHRYFLWIKQSEFTLGNATDELRAIGKLLADTPA
jgi:alkylation response protein AidB-like acyl-CoA dehydrogenase